MAPTCPTYPAYADGALSVVNMGVWIGRGQFDPAQVSGGYTEYAGFAGQGFGIVVTKALYDAMQVKQGVPNPADDAPGVNQPNITRQQFTSILSASGGYHTDWQPIVGAAGVGKAINLIRYPDDSSTQAAMEVFFLDNPCRDANAPTFGALKAATVADSVPGEFEVRQTYYNYDNRRELAVRNQVADANQFAIGVLSLWWWDSTDYKYVKLDGVSPNEDYARRKSVIDGRYNFAMEMSFVYRNDAPARAKTFMRSLVKEMARPDTLGMGLNTGTFNVTGADYRASYVAFPTRVHRGTRSGNACQAYQLYE